MYAKEDILPSSNPRSPFYLNLPKTDAKPIDELVKYFKNYKQLVKNLLHYFREIVLVKEFEANLNNQIIASYTSCANMAVNGATTSAVSPNSLSTNLKGLGSKLLNPQTDGKRPNLLKTKSNSNQTFASLSSFRSITPSTKSPMINTINSTILTHHQHLYQLNMKHHKELTSKLIPKLENLLKNLSIKIKEIRSSLKNDSFVNDNILKEISKTGAILKDYMQAVETYNTHHIIHDGNDDDEEENEDAIDPYTINKKLDDPFLIKLKLNYQVKNQLIKENYLFAAFINLQNISKELLTYILKDLYSILEKFDKINPLNIHNLNINFDPNSEWENFITTNPNFINIYHESAKNPKKEIRHFKNIVLPYSSSIHNKCIRFGILYKKSKLLKNYNRYYYLLTCNYLHEFRIETSQSNASASSPNEKPKAKLTGFINHNDIPIKSYNLNNYKIIVKNEKNHKFNLIKLTSGKATSFKCSNSMDFQNWFTDLNDLLKFESDNKARFAFVEKKLSMRDSMKEDTESPTYSANQTPKSSQQTLSNGSSSLSLPLNNNNNGGKNNISAAAVTQSLQGVFTPTVRTPSSSGSDKNPFDQSFKMNNTVGSGTGSQPHSQPHSAHNSNPTSPNASFQHENYLKIQQEYLKQQQTMINLQLKEVEKKNMGNGGLSGSNPSTISGSNPSIVSGPLAVPAPASASNTTPTNPIRLGVHSHSNSVESINLGSLDLNLRDLPQSSDSNDIHRSASNQSLVSLESNNHRINQFLQQNQDLVPKFFVTDEDVSSDKPVE